MLRCKQIGGTWSCTGCTYNNTDQTTKCAMCNTPKQSNVQVQVRRPEEKDTYDIILRIDNIRTKFKCKKMEHEIESMLGALIKGFEILKIHEDIRTVKIFKDKIQEFAKRKKDLLINKYKQHGDFIRILSSTPDSMASGMNINAHPVPQVISFLALMLKICIRILKPINPIDSSRFTDATSIDAKCIELQSCDCTTHTITLFDPMISVGGNIRDKYPHYDLVISQQLLDSDTCYRNEQYISQNKEACKQETIELL